MTLPEDASALTAMITPTLFLTITGSLIIASSNRMSRIADRIHELNERGDELSCRRADLDFPGERLDQVSVQVGTLLWRSDRIRLALTFLYLALALFAGTDLALACQVLAGSRVALLPTALAVSGVLLLLFACIHLAREARASLRGNREEIEFYQELRRKRRGSARGAESSGR